MAKVSFDAVHLDHEVPKLGGHMGQVYANTSYFSSKGGYRVDLETESSLVYITHETGAAVVVPRERVKRFEPLLADVAVVPAPEKRGPGRPRKEQPQGDV